MRKYGAKYPQAVACLRKDKAEMLAFYDYPEGNWRSIRTSNPIESTFATIRHRTRQARGCLSPKSMVSMMFKLGLCAQRNWHRLSGYQELGKLLDGVKFKDGKEV